MKIGLPKEYLAMLAEPAFARVFDAARSVLESLGHTLVEVSLPHTAAAVPTWTRTTT